MTTCPMKTTLQNTGEEKRITTGPSSPLDPPIDPSIQELSQTPFTPNARYPIASHASPPAPNREQNKQSVQLAPQLETQFPNQERATPTVQQPQPAPTVQQPQPAPTVEQPQAAPTVEQPQLPPKQIPPTTIPPTTIPGNGPPLTTDHPTMNTIHTPQHTTTPTYSNNSNNPYPTPPQQSPPPPPPDNSHPLPERSNNTPTNPPISRCQALYRSGKLEIPSTDPRTHYYPVHGKRPAYVSDLVWSTRGMESDVFERRMQKMIGETMGMMNQCMYRLKA